MQNLQNCIREKKVVKKKTQKKIKIKIKKSNHFCVIVLNIKFKTIAYAL